MTTFQPSRINAVYYVNAMLKSNSFVWQLSQSLSAVKKKLATIMIKTIAFTFFTSAISMSAFAISMEETEQRDPKSLTASLVKKQVEQNISIGRAVKSIISHYPEQTVQVVDTAIDLYPQQYKEIIYAAISSEPSLTREIVTVAIDKGLSCTSVVETAIQAEPSYVDFVVDAAANSTPEELDEIVRIAVMTEPDSADHIVQTLAKSHPNKMIDIIKTALGAVPYVGEYIVDALLAAFPDDAESVVTAAAEKSTGELQYLQQVAHAARNAGISEEHLKQYMLNAGVNQRDLEIVLNR